MPVSCSLMSLSGYSVQNLTVGTTTGIYFMLAGEPRAASDIAYDKHRAWSVLQVEESGRISVGLSLGPLFVVEKKFSLIILLLVPYSKRESHI